MCSLSPEQLDQQLGRARSGSSSTCAPGPGCPGARSAPLWASPRGPCRSGSCPARRVDHAPRRPASTVLPIHDRAVGVLFAADHLAASPGRHPGAGQAQGRPAPIGAAQLAAAFLSEPEGLAAKAFARAATADRCTPRSARAGPASCRTRTGRAASSWPSTIRQGGVQGGAQVGAAHRPQLHRHRAPAARRAVPEGPVAEAFTDLGCPRSAPRSSSRPSSPTTCAAQGQLGSMGRNHPAPETGELPRGSSFASPCGGSRVEALAAQREVSQHVYRHRNRCRHRHHRAHRPGPAPITDRRSWSGTGRRAIP